MMDGWHGWPLATITRVKYFPWAIHVVTASWFFVHTAVLLMESIVFCPRSGELMNRIWNDSRQCEDSWQIFQVVDQLPRKIGVDSVWPLHPTMGAVCEIKPCQRIQSKVANLTVPSTFPCCRWAATSLCAGCSKLCRVQISNFKYMCSITDIVVAESKSVTYPALLDWICCDHIIQFKCLRPTAAGMGSSVWLSNLHHWCYLAFGAFGEHTDCSRIG